MHELSIASAIVATAQKHADGSVVSVVTVRAGRLRQVVPESLEFYWDLVTRGTVCDGAWLELEVVPAVLACASCAHEWALEAPLFRCPACGGTDVTVVRGNELEVESIEKGGSMHRTRVKVLEDVLDANSTIAAANRADFDRAGVTVINIMSAPGAGKTSLLERVLRMLDGVRVGVLEGDVQTTLDADRLASLHIPVTQINTDPGFGGECHLDANMVRSALSSLTLEELDLLLIENVGNLVCPAEFRVGEDHRVMVSSVAEGEDKPLKYPLMFRACELVIVNKLDLLPHLDFDLDRYLYNLDAVHPGVERLLVSARTGEGIDALRDWLFRIATREAAAV